MYAPHRFIYTLIDETAGSVTTFYLHPFIVYQMFIISVSERLLGSSRPGGLVNSPCKG